MGHILSLVLKLQTPCKGTLEDIIKLFNTQKTKPAVKERERVMQHRLCILADVAPAAVPECR